MVSLRATKRGRGEGGKAAITASAVLSNLFSRCLPEVCGLVITL